MEHFKRGLAIFDAKAKSAKRGALADPLAEFRFVHAVALAVESRRISEKNGFKGPKMPDRRTVKAALGHIQKLEACMDGGVRLRDIPENGTLRSGLARLREQIEAEDLNARKPRNDRTAAARYFTTHLVNEFLASFGDPLTAVVCELAPLLGYGDDVDSRTIEKLASEQRRQRKPSMSKMLAKALRKTFEPANNSKKQPKSTTAGKG